MAPLLVISGPSGIGKTYLVEQLKEHGFLPVLMTTTRPPRPNEVPGVDYEFLERGEYDRATEETADFFMNNEFFGHKYGIRRSAIERIWELGKVPVLAIYIQVVGQVIQAYPAAKRVYLVPAHVSLLQKRLRLRNGSDEPETSYRLEKAKEELALIRDLRYQALYDSIITVQDDGNESLIQCLIEFAHR
ncbi:MAG: Guanylate kinase [Patescibacteria group bacterium]|nr:Guanylate kinase [Patescibacteria group bacterium]